MNPPKRMTATMTTNEEISDGIRKFRFGLSEPIDFLPGQYLNLRFPDEKRYHAFSIASSPTIKGEIELVIKLHGEFTQRLFSCEPGAAFECMAPLGRFMQGIEEDLVMIAGGVGVTPFFSFLREARETNEKEKEFWLFYSCRTRDQIIFEKELRKLHEQNPHLHVIFTLTREQPEGWNGENGHFNGEMLKKYLDTFDGKTFATCGPTKMVEAIIAMLEKAGVPSEKILHESWG